MKNLYRTSPDGTKDYIYREAEMKSELIDALRSNYIFRGFGEVVTPSVEYYELFTAKTGTVPSELMYKMTDRQNRLLVCRPDNTAPIARVVSTRLKDVGVPIKLHYTQSVLREEDGLSGKPSEIMQSGVEMIGSRDLRADLEVIYTAYTSLLISGTGFKLEIGHVGFYNALIGKIPLSAEDRRAVQTYIEYKNHSALLDVLSAYSQYKESAALAKLPFLFGGTEIIDEARTLTDDPAATGCLDYLERLIRELDSLGISENFTIDLGLVQQLDYYTGLVFKGYADGAGREVLSGGRYDNLYALFGKAKPAVGFAIDVDTLSALRNKEEDEQSLSDILIFYQEGFAKEAYKLSEKYLVEGVIAELDVSGDFETARAYAVEKKISKLAVVGQDGIKEVAL